MGNNVSVGDNVWFDDSDGHAEWETNDVNLVKIKLQLPERVLKLEQDVSGIKDSISSLVSKIDTLVDLFNSPKPPDRRVEDFYV